MRTIVAVVVAIAAVSGYGANVEGHPTQDRRPYVYGAGALLCGEWTEGRKDRQDLFWIANSQWVLGYVSAKSDSGRLGQVNSAAIDSWIDKYCGEHPLDHVYKAAGALVEELSR